MSGCCLIFSSSWHRFESDNSLRVSFLSKLYGCASWEAILYVPNELSPALFLWGLIIVPGALQVVLPGQRGLSSRFS